MSQRNAREAFAGGAVCRQEELDPEEVEACDRVPVLYATDEESGWRETYRSAASGYVGAIAWIGRGRALAVGGSGTYPRREPNAVGDEWDYAARLEHDREEGAGDARAWYFHDVNGDGESEWEEISDELPPEMGGLTALDLWMGREPNGDEWGLAGDYGHIWEWRGGQFTGKHIDHDSPGIGSPDPHWAVVDGPSAFTQQCSGFGENQTCTWEPAPNAGSSSPDFFQYRVREIRIAPDRTQKRAFAFTSGCCGPSNATSTDIGDVADLPGSPDTANVSRRIEYVPRPKKHEAGVPPSEAPPRENRPRWTVSSDESYGESVYSFGVRQTRMLNWWGGPDEFGEPQPEHGAPLWEVGSTIVATARPDGEEPEGADTSTAPPEPRYVSSDGDSEDETFNGNMPVKGNGTPDWMVGEAPPGNPAHEGLGAIATTVDDYRPEYGGVRPYCNLPPHEGAPGAFEHHEAVVHPGDGFSTIFWAPDTAYIRVCRAEQIQTGQMQSIDPDGPIKTRESGVQLGPSWSLNSVDLLDSENVGYAVGDRGAILRFGSIPEEGSPPSLGARRPTQLVDAGPYEERRPPTPGAAGEVPPLVAQPRTSFSEARLVRAGSPDGSEIGTRMPAEDVHTIVMSRDGTEGWALGPTPEARGLGSNAGGGVMTLHHYEDGQWTRCDPIGNPPIVPADRECAELAPLYRHRGQNGQRIRIDTAARVPLEYDDNPANDDEFEVLAVGSSLEVVNETGFSPRPIPAVIRYRNGSWKLEPFEVRNSLNRAGEGAYNFHATWSSLACTGPDECWLVGVQSTAVLRRFDGERWFDCTPSTQGPPNPACDDSMHLPRLSRDGFWGELSVTSAGERTYLGGVRLPPNAQAAQDRGQGSPVILYKDHGEQWSSTSGGYDPGFDDPSAQAGAVTSIAVAQRADGSYEGWATGAFEAPGTVPLAQGRTLARWPLLRLDPDTGEWAPHRVRDAAFDYLGIRLTAGFEGTNPARQVTIAGGSGTPGRAYIATNYPFPGLPSHLLSFNPERERWELAEKPGPALYGNEQKARALSLSSDGRGGIWAAFGTEGQSTAQSGRSNTYYYNYTASPREEVFEEVSQPLAARERITDMAGSTDGTVWLATEQGALYRRDRITGWQRVTIPGWDPGNIVLRPSSVKAVAVSPDGTGLAVGPGGRIAEISGGTVRLDEAAGAVCEPSAPAPPCGTSFDLRSAAATPGGSALAGGEKLALLWRPAGGELRKIPPPDGPRTAAIVDIAMPAPDRAWLVLDSGHIFAGVYEGSGRWRWGLENVFDVHGVDRLPNEDEDGVPIPLRAIAVDASGRGFAVGDRGVILERTQDNGKRWVRSDSGVTERLMSVSLGEGRGGALIGGEHGLVLTWGGEEWRLARAGDLLRPDNGHVIATSLLPGVEEGQSEAWAAVAPARADVRLGSSQLLHYTDAPEEPLLDAAGSLEALPDAPPARDGEIAFAAFGRSDCHLVDETNLIPCPPLENGTDIEQLILRRVRDDLLARSLAPGGPQFAIFTGDAYDTAGSTAMEPVEQNSRLAAQAAVFGTSSAALLDVKWTPGEKYRRLNEQLPDHLRDRGLPLFAAVGARDLSEARACATTTVSIHCVENRDRARVGENLAWRQAMESQPAPWGAAEPVVAGGLAFEPLRDSDLAVRADDQEVEDPRGGESTEIDGGEDIEVEIPQPGTNFDRFIPGEASVSPRTKLHPLDPARAPAGGASTHYAADVVRGEKPVARLVVADTSAGSLSGSDPIQQPLEAEGGQAAWLERVLCVKGGPYDTGQCTREASQQAIVVSSTPTYSYGSTNPTELQADGAIFESIVLRHGVNVVVSGRLGWNGRYWTLAPGLHEPCPGQDYVPDEDAPSPGQPRVCGQQVAGLPTGPEAAAGDAQRTATSALGDPGGTGAVPFVVASNAGGRFSDFGSGARSAPDGFWRGYSVVRLHPSGDPQKTIVEQRPVLDWIRVDGGERLLGANERLDLRGLGREPLGAPIGQIGSGRFDELSTPAITHRFDLVLAHPDEPWRACEADDASCVSLWTKLAAEQSATQGAAPSPDANKCHPYLCLPERIGTIDRYSGGVRAGNGKYPDTFAIALLSVADRSASYPLMFKRSPSFVVAPVRLSAPLPSPPSVVSNPPQPPSPPNPPTPTVPQPAAPQVPTPPPVPPIAASEPPEPLPPAPPAPPPPAEQLSPLDLTINPASLTVSTPAAVIQPPTPPVNPAPPSGARREARQRQAAAQKSGADNEESAEDQQFDGANSPNNAPGAGFTRHDHSFTARRQGRPEPSFTTLSRADDSAGDPTLLYTGGITLLALAAALGFTHGRPTPRRRPPEVPAPAWARRDSRRR